MTQTHLETINDIDDLKEFLKRRKIKYVENLNKNSILFILGIPRKPEFLIGYNPVLKIFSLTVEAEKNNKSKMVIYSGRNFDGKGLLYMLRIQINYFRKLKR